MFAAVKPPNVSFSPRHLARLWLGSNTISPVARKIPGTLSGQPRQTGRRDFREDRRHHRGGDALRRVTMPPHVGQLVLVREAVEDTSVVRLLERTTQPDGEVLGRRRQQDIVGVTVVIPGDDPCQRVVLGCAGGLVLQELHEIVAMCPDEAPIDVNEAVRETAPASHTGSADAYGDRLSRLLRPKSRCRGLAPAFVLIESPAAGTDDRFRRRFLRAQVIAWLGMMGERGVGGALVGSHDDLRWYA